MIKIHLSRILGEKRIKQRELARKTGIRTSTIGAYYHERAVRFEKSHIDSICRTLKISPGELLEYIPDGEPEEK